MSSEEDNICPICLSIIEHQYAIINHKNEQKIEKKYCRDCLGKWYNGMTKKDILSDEIILSYNIYDENDELIEEIILIPDDNANDNSNEESSLLETNVERMRPQFDNVCTCITIIYMLILIYIVSGLAAEKN
jgi:hypothetical protein